MDNSWTVMLREWAGHEPIHIFLIVVVAWGLYQAVRIVTPLAIKKSKAPADRFYTLPWIPLIRLTIIVGAIVLIVPLVIIPTKENILALVGASALAVGFALKDYISCIFAGLLFLVERPYRVGDWIEIGGTYGEVTELGLRAVTLVTADDNTIAIPHNTLWTAQLVNATGGNRDLMAVTDFYIHPDQDHAPSRQILEGIAKSSKYINPDRPVTLVMFFKPFGVHYRLKAYPLEARDQFLFITDLTERGLAALRKAGLKPVISPVAVAEDR